MEASFSDASPVVIDTDMGPDDAVAVSMVLRTRPCPVKAITVVAGVTNLWQAASNALLMRQLCESEVAVFVGRDGPLRRPLITADAVHGSDGFGNFGPDVSAAAELLPSAHSALLALAHEYAGQLRIVALGPLTNVAQCCLDDTAFPGLIKECIVMGTAIESAGNVSPVAEYNIYVDPDAAAIVYSAGVPLRVVTWDACLADASVTDEEFGRIEAVDTELARFCVAIQGTTREWVRREVPGRGTCVADALAMRVAMDPAVVTYSTHGQLAIDVTDGERRGMVKLYTGQGALQGHTADMVLRASRACLVEAIIAAVS